MQVVDERANLLGVIHLGAERIRLTKRETQQLKAALKVLNTLRARREVEYKLRGYGEMSSDIADLDDDMTLASAQCWLGELIDQGEANGSLSELAFDLPFDKTKGGS